MSRLHKSIFSGFRLALVRNEISRAGTRALLDLEPSFVPQITTFVQAAPKLENQYDGDAMLSSYLHRVLPDNVIKEIEPDLKRFGSRVATDIYEHGLECERTQPYVNHYDAWGNRVDEIVTSNSWKKMKEISAEEGLIAIAYEKRYGEWSRLYQLSKNFLFTRSSGLYSCPLAMTDGAAKTIESLNLQQLSDAFQHLTSRDPRQFWTSGQWMTEKQGGSDVASGTETTAVPLSDGTWQLYGYKWFSSATDSDMTLTLARIADEQGRTIDGTKGVSMFYLETRNQDGKLNDIEIVKLKDKLGTRQLPTAELILKGSKALLISEEGKGIASISNMLTITRIHNALASTAAMRGILSLARDYSHRRVAFGKPVIHHPLHVQTLADMELETRGATIFVLETARLLGLHDMGDQKSENVQLLRLLTPLVKLYTAKQSMAVVSEGLEAFGGQGYIEETGIPRILRDAQVTPIWEGTTNILSLDLLRVLAKQPDIILIFQKNIVMRLATAKGIQELERPVLQITNHLDDVIKFITEHQDKLMVCARELAFSISRIYIGALLIEHAAWRGSTKQDKISAIRWSQKDLTPVIKKFRSERYTKEAVINDKDLVLQNYKFTP